MQYRPFVMLLAVLAVLGLGAPVAAQQANRAATGAAEEQQIRDAAIAFVQRYNAHQASELAALFMPDARMTYADGIEINGREEIQRSFEEAFQSSPQVAVSVVVESIRFVTSDVAVEEGATSLFPDGETLASRGKYTVLHLKKDGRWLMQAVRVHDDEVLSAYGELQALEWLIGEWVDEGRTETVEAKFRWDENKAFLLEEFQVIREGSVVLKGTQRIGWDPQRKQVRSWIFDSAGGFGEAWWTPAGGDWICKVTGVQSDGTAVSATRILTKVTAERVLWTAMDRLVGAERLPGLVVTMVRKPPQPE